MKAFIFTISFIAISIFTWAQQGLKSGPWAGNIELRNAIIWAEVMPNVKSVSVKVTSTTEPADTRIIKYDGTLGKDFNPVKIPVNGLKFNTVYSYTLFLDGKPVNTSFKTNFKTKDLWQYRKPVPDFSFLAGSCAYFNEPLYDRPGPGYGGDSSIFETMSRTGADFNIWLGDNWYTREVDYYTVWGLNYRPSRDRSLKVLQPFMASMPQYMIWDDHDYGPNDAGADYIFKNESREIFASYSTNPSYGMNKQGIYTMYSWNDADFFLTDNRFFRSQPEIKDSINGTPNTDKHFFGPEQMNWLKNSLLFSRATFKFIIVGSQVLNPLNRFECMNKYPVEKNELINFITEHRIRGVIFITGDRHHSEIIQIDRPNTYPLYDITVSPLTAGISKARDAEANNPYRVANTLIEQQNFGKFSITGTKGNRKLTVAFTGIKGNVLSEWTIMETALK